MSAPENPQAFPLRARSNGSIFEQSHEGMTLRDWFAGQAFTSAMASGHRLGELPPDKRAELFRRIAGLVYEASDAMLAARTQSKDTPK